VDETTANLFIIHHQKRSPCECIIYISPFLHTTQRGGAVIGGRGTTWLAAVHVWKTFLDDPGVAVPLKPPFINNIIVIIDQLQGAPNHRWVEV